MVQEQRLDTRLTNIIEGQYPEWQLAISILDPGWRLLRESLKKSVLYFGYQVSASKPANPQTLWFDLLVYVVQMYGDLDRVGLSGIIGEVVGQNSIQLMDFSFSEKGAFRRFEEYLLRDLEIPTEIWDKFWILVDQNKGPLIQVMKSHQGAYNFHEHFFPQFDTVSKRGPGTTTAMSFKWSLATIVSVGTLLGSVNGGTAIPTAGLSLLSLVGSAIAAGYAAGKG